MDFNNIHATATATATKKVEDSVGRVLVALEEMLEGSLPANIKVRVTDQIADLIENAGGSLLTPDGITAAINGQHVAALGAGAPAPIGNPDNSAIMAALEAMANDLGVPDAQTLVANMGRMFAPVLAEPDPRVRNARLVGMAKAGDGSIPFTATGDVDHSAAIAAVQAELDNERDPLHVGSLAHQLAAANRDLGTRTTERDAAITAGNTLQQERDELVADFAELDTELSGGRQAKAVIKRALRSASDRLKGRLTRTMS